MSHGDVHVGFARVELRFPAVGSLKSKRALLNRTKAWLRDELGCSVAEVDAQDQWQRSVLGVAVAASTATGVDRVLDRLPAVSERDPRIVVTGLSTAVEVLDADASGLDGAWGAVLGAGGARSSDGPVADPLDTVGRGDRREDREGDGDGPQGAWT